MLRFLLDEHLSPAIVGAIRATRPEIPACSVLDWNAGIHRGIDDETLLRAASTAGWTLVTYDQRTIPAVLEDWALSGETHSGVIFISRRSIPQNNFGGLAKALTAFWDQHERLDWTNRLGYLQKPKS